MIHKINAIIANKPGIKTFLKYYFNATEICSEEQLLDVLSQLNKMLTPTPQKPLWFIKNNYMLKTDGTDLYIQMVDDSWHKCLLDPSDDSITLIK